MSILVFEPKKNMTTAPVSSAPVKRAGENNPLHHNIRHLLPTYRLALTFSLHAYILYIFYVIDIEHNDYGKLFAYILR